MESKVRNIPRTGSGEEKPLRRVVCFLSRGLCLLLSLYFYFLRPFELTRSFVGCTEHR